MSSNIAETQIRKGIIIYILVLNLHVFINNIWLFQMHNWDVPITLSFTDVIALLEKDTSCSATQEFPKFHGTPNVHYRVHKSTLLVPTLSQMSPVHTSPSSLSELHCNLQTLINYALWHEDIWGSGVLAPPFLIWALKWRWVVSLLPRPLSHRERTPGIHWSYLLMRWLWVCKEVILV
jgi:hypothetical protein